MGISIIGIDGVETNLAARAPAENAEDNYELLLMRSFENDNKYLKNGEILSKTWTPLSISIKNVGKEDFPGGKITDFFSRFENLQQNYETRDCPSIKVEEEILIYKKRMSVLTDGLGWLHIHLKSIDDKKIKFYQDFPDKPLATDHWVSPIYSVNKYQILILEALNDIKEILTRSKSGPNG